MQAEQRNAVVERVEAFARWLHSYGRPKYGAITVNDSPTLYAADLRALIALAKQQSPVVDEELMERCARAAFAAHHASGPTDEAYGEPNWGRGGFKTERAVWEAVVRAVLSTLANR